MASVMSSLAKNSRTLSRLTLSTAVAVLFAVAVVAVRSAREDTERAAAALIDSAADRAEAQIRDYFEPLERLAVVLAEWGKHGGLPLGDPDQLTRTLAPILEHFPVSSMMIADSTGSEYTLFQKERGAEVRQSRPRDWGDVARWIAYDQNLRVVRRWEKPLVYDPRTRPWFRAAVAASGKTAISEPHIFFTTKEPGVTAARTYRSNGSTHVVGLDLLLVELSRMTARIDVTPNGRVLLSTRDGRLLGLPKDARYASARRAQDAVLKTATQLGLLAESLALKEAPAAANAAHFPLDVDGESWWAGVRQLDVGGSQYSVLAVIPDADVTGPQGSRRDTLLAAFSATVLAVGLLVLFGLWRVRRAVRVAMQSAEQVGQYRLEERLGSGGMGTVYRARHALLKRPTAVKLVDADRAHDPAAIRRFQREVEATSQLTHPNTISVYDFGSTKEGYFYYAMEYLDGADLDSVVQLTGPMTPGRVVYVILQACGSLQEAHEAGLIHRDIKPANIMLCTRGGIHDFVKVLDFGLVKDTGLNTQTNLTIAGSSSDGSGPLTQATNLLGTPQYMSPEAIATPQKVGPATDIYALGAVMWYLLVGESVFEATSLMDLCLKHTTEAPRRPSSLRPDVPADLEAIVMACLEKDPDKRPGTAALLARQLKRCDCADDWSEEVAEAWWNHHGEKFLRSGPDPDAPEPTDLTLADAPTLASEHP